MQKYLKDSLFQTLSETAEKLNTEVYLIGGYVRDILLNRKSNDIDIVVIGDGIKFAKAVADDLKGKKHVSVFKRFGTAMINHNGKELEFVGARKESYTSDSRKPAVSQGTIDDDRNRRDFTINALAISLNKSNYGELIDTFNGQQDLKDKIIRTPLEPGRTFSDDPLRMIRAVRFASQLGFDIFPDTLQGIKNNKDRIKIVSKERIVIELNKILMSPKPSVGFRLMDETGLLEYVFPELSKLKGVDIRKGISHKDNFYHTIEVVDNIAEHTDDLWLRWAALLHDIAKPDTKRFTGDAWTFHGHEFLGYKQVPEIFARMRLPLNKKMEYVRKLVRLHLRPIALVDSEITDSAVRRLLFEAGDEIDDLMILCEADITSKNEWKVRRFKNNFKEVRIKLKEVEDKDKLRNWQPPVSGEEIMAAFAIKPSKVVGDIKNAIREAILDGEIENSQESALEYMYKKGKELGLSSESK
ncbi:MAG: HD domain-containing protein [Bacteroidota bacterium]|nr:HD domain-containing protein [Bacteroidota bacterium]